MKFKVGDKVKVINSQHYLKNSYVGKTGTILRNEKSCDSNENRWILNLTPVYVFFDSELELVEKVNITINPNDRAGAHKAVEEAIAEYKKKKTEWTEDELAQAEKLYKDYLAEFVNKGHIPEFEVKNGKVYLYEFRHASFSVGTFTYKIILPNTVEKYKAYSATPEKDDVFNETIGKVVLLCKALKKPIPDFIKNKNT